MIPETIGEGQEIGTEKVEVREDLVEGEERRSKGPEVAQAESWQVGKARRSSLTSTNRTLFSSRKRM